MDVYLTVIAAAGLPECTVTTGRVVSDDVAAVDRSERGVLGGKRTEILSLLTFGWRRPGAVGHGGHLSQMCRKQMNRRTVAGWLSRRTEDGDALCGRPAQGDATGIVAKLLTSRKQM